MHSEIITSKLFTMASLKKIASFLFIQMLRLKSRAFKNGFCSSCQVMDDMLDGFFFQLNIRDEEVQRLNTKIRQLNGEIKDLQSQLELKDERVSTKICHI